MRMVIVHLVQLRAAYEQALAEAQQAASAGAWLFIIHVGRWPLIVAQQTWADRGWRAGALGRLAEATGPARATLGASDPNSLSGRLLSDGRTPRATIGECRRR